MNIFNWFRKTKVPERNSWDWDDEEIAFQKEKEEWLAKIPECNTGNETSNGESKALLGFQADLYKVFTHKKLWEQDRWKRV